MDIDNNYSIQYVICNRREKVVISTNVGTLIHYYYVNEIIGLSCVYRNSLIFFRFTVIFINLLGTATYVSSPMHGKCKESQN